MKAAWALFDSGNKKAAREAAVKLLDAPPSPADGEEAKELLARLAPPPAFKTFALLAATFICGLLLVAVLRG